MAPELEQVVALLRSDPAGTALLFDFDGTLAPIVDDPADAAPIPGAAEALADLARSYAVVAVISGRPIRHLQAHLQPGPLLVGLYGLERLRNGVVEENPAVGDWRATIDDVAEAAASELPPDVGVEHKGVSLTLHVRTHPHLAAEIDAWAAAAAQRWGLHQRGAKMSTELHPPVEVDKGTVASELVTGVETACFVGDDLGDLPAFAALDRFVADGGTARKLVVSSPEMAPAMADAADLLIEGPAGVLELLRALQA